MRFTKSVPCVTIWRQHKGHQRTDHEKDKQIDAENAGGASQPHQLHPPREWIDRRCKQDPDQAEHEYIRDAQEQIGDKRSQIAPLP